MREKLKNNCGVSAIKLILRILIFILLIFLVYEVFFVTILGMEEKINPINTSASLNQIKDTINKNTEKDVGTNEVKNTQVISPAIDEQYFQMSESTNLVNHYYYNQLDENAKIIYKGIEDNIENMESGQYKIDFGTKFNNLLNSQNGEEKLNIAFQSAWNAFTYDYVDIFYIDVTKLILTTQTTTLGSFSTHKVYISNGTNANYYTEEIKSYSDVKQKKEYISKVREQIVSQLEGYSDYDKIKYLHDWIVDNFEYDTTYEKSDIHNVYGAFANRNVVCEGYARAFKYILDALEINSVLVSGTGTNSKGVTEAHAWNYIELGGKWYAVDITWDDPIITGGGNLTKDLRYKYFLVGSDRFLNNHKEDGYLSQNSIKFTFPTLEKENY